MQAGYDEIKPVHKKPAVAKVQKKTVHQKNDAVEVLILDHVPAIQGGSTSYLPSAGQLHLLDPERLAQQALAIQRAAIESQTTYHKNTLSFLERIVELQKPTQEIYARGETTRSVIEAATRALRAGGEGAVVRPKWESKIPLTMAACEGCHGAADAQGGFALQKEFNVALALSAVAGGTMPKNSDLTDAERLAIVNELVRYGVGKDQSNAQ